MPRRHLTSAIALAVATTLGACSGSDDTPATDTNAGATPAPGGQPSAAGQGPQGAGALMAEFQQVQQRLGQIQQQAMTDPELQERFATIQQHIQEEMSAADENFEEKQNQLRQLQQDMTAAQQSGDQDAVSSINQEGMALQMELQELQTAALEDEEIAAEVEAFQEDVEAKMTEIDPETPQLLERADEISAQLQGGMAPGGGAPPAQGSQPEPEETPGG